MNWIARPLAANGNCAVRTAWLQPLLDIGVPAVLAVKDDDFSRMSKRYLLLDTPTLVVVGELLSLLVGILHPALPPATDVELRPAGRSQGPA